MQKINRFFAALLSSSFLWGGLAALGFFALIDTGTIQGEFCKRYFAGHWVEYIETAMFFIGMAALLLKMFDLSDQKARLSKPLLGEPPVERIAPADATQVLDQLAALPSKYRHGYLPRRLREAVEAIIRKDSADELDDELKYLSDVDAGRAHASHAMLRIFIWAIPILGFLGTVIGITMAIASLDPKALEGSMTEVTAGLGVAFDTTALALSLSMGLMFGQFFVDRMESSLLAKVDEKAAQELAGRFQMSISRGDPQLSAVEQMAEAVITSVAQLVERQAEVWRQSFDTMNRRWSELTTNSGQHLEQALSKSLSRSMQTHAETLAAADATVTKTNRRQWRKLHKSLAKTTETSQTQHVELVRQGEIMLKLVNATGQVTRLEDTLNHNLSALAGSQQLQETLLNLTATMNLLHARLGHIGPVAAQVGLKDTRVSKAA